MQKELLLPLFIHCPLKNYTKIREVHWCLCCHLRHNVDMTATYTNMNQSILQQLLDDRLVRMLLSNFFVNR